MKKFLLSLVLLCTVLSLAARTPEEAAEVANGFLTQLKAQQSSSAHRSKAVIQPLSLAFTQYQKDAISPAVYVFSSSDNQGFVLVSAKDETRAILGYADRGKFDANNIPENMQFWLQMYADEIGQITSLQSNQLPNQQSVKKTVVRRAQEEYSAVEPILAGVCWGQMTPYNDMCPIVGGEKAPSGCAATAVGQIMYQHKYPDKGIGSKSYTSNTYQVSLSADFGSTTYDWANMIPDYSNGYTPTQATAVATLLSHLGVAAEMDYAPGGSATGAYKIFEGLINYFGYDKGITILPKDYLAESEMLTRIAEDLRLGHPVYFRGTTIKDEGHAFVCDGISSEGYLHINWGWDGYSDGYYALSAFNPLDQGVGGSNSDEAYTKNVVAYTGIQPDRGGEYQPCLTVSSMLRQSPKQIHRYDDVEFDMSFVYNLGISNILGTFVYRIYNEQGNLVTTVNDWNYIDVNLSPTYYYTEDLTISRELPYSLQPGNYYLEIALEDDMGNVHPILVMDHGVKYFPITITEDAIIFYADGGPDGDEVENPDWQYASIEDAQCIYVEGTNQWNLDLTSSRFWESTPSAAEVLIRMTIHNESATSVIGTYVLDPSNSGAHGTIDANALFAYGYSQACYQYTPSVLRMTITPGQDGKLDVQFYMVVDGETYDHICHLTPEWVYKYNNQYYYYDEYITYDLSAKLSSSSALNLIQSMGYENFSKMNYFVQGIVSYMYQTPEQIVGNNAARFDISDDGTTDYSLDCRNVRWLNNSDFSTGKEIQVRDEVVLYGTLLYDNDRIPIMNGYVYSIDSNSTDVENVQGEDTRVYKVVQDGRVLIWRGGKCYTLTGLEL